MTLYLHSLLSPMPQEKAIQPIGLTTCFLGTEPCTGIRSPFLSKLRLPFYLHQSMLQKPENIDTL